MVGPTEALRGPTESRPDRAEAPGDLPEAPREAPRDRADAWREPTEAPRDWAEARPDAVPGLLDRERKSGWQLAQRVWRDSGVDWEDTPAPAQPPYQEPDPYAVDSYSVDSYSVDSYPSDADYPADADDPVDGSDIDEPYPAADLNPAHRYPPAPSAIRYAPARYPDDPHPTRFDLPALPAAADSRLGLGPWPIQPHPEATRAEPAIAEREPAQSTQREDLEPEQRQTADRDRADRDRTGRRPDERGQDDRGSGEHGQDDRSFGVYGPNARGLGARGVRDEEPGSAATPDSVARPVAQPAPPLPRRTRRMGAGWNEHPPGDLPARSGPGDRDGQAPPLPPPVQSFARSSAFAPSSPFAPSPAFVSPQLPVASPPLGTPRPFASAPLSAPVAPAAPPLGEPDELFRAWQGSVMEATGRRAPWSGDRPAGPRRAGPRGRGWQVARIGVPAAVIVTVGAGALMMLTGRANEMLAERGNPVALSSGRPSADAVSPGQASGTATAAGKASGQAGAGLTLAGYPSQHGTVGVAAMWSAGGTTMAVGYADAHPAVWRHATDGTWSLVSTAVLGGLTGHLTSVAQGPSGWIAVGSMNEDGTVEPVVFGSSDGVTWTPQSALTGLAGSDGQFLGVAAGTGGYLVVGKQGSGNQAHVALWWSADLKNWVNGQTSGSAGSFAVAAVAVGNGFVAVGSENNCHTIWTSPDGRNWAAHDLAKPSGATTASLDSVTVDQGGRFVAAGSATTGTGDIPIVVTSADGGANVTQVVLTAPQGPATVTAVTATSNGFVAVGEAGPASAQRAVTWTSPDAQTWSTATELPAAGASGVTALTDTGTTVTATAQHGTTPALLTVPTP
ncbi:MAG: hypothetical protein ACRDOI_43600 [Trebonia sp.]